MRPTYFDLTVNNLEEAMSFFGKVLGWKFERFPMPYSYFRIQAGPETEEGIDGGIGAVADAPAAAGLPSTQVTIPVPDLDAALRKVVDSGGRIWVALVGLNPAGYGTHSMRRTKVSLVYKKTGNLRACQLLLGHTKLESTVRYLGVEVDDALELSEALEL